MRYFFRFRIDAFFSRFRPVPIFFKILGWCTIFQDFGSMHHFSRFQSDALFFKISDWCIIFQDFGRMLYFSRFRTDALFFKLSYWCIIFQDIGLMYYFSRFREMYHVFKISDWCIIFQDFGLMHYFSRFRTGALFFKISDWCTIFFQDFGLMHYCSSFRTDVLFFNISDFRTVFQDIVRRNFEKQYIIDTTTFYRHVQIRVYSQLLCLISTSLTETLCIWRRPCRNPHDSVMWPVVYSRWTEWWFRRSQLTWPDCTVHTVLREGWVFVQGFVETEYLADFCEHGNDLLTSLKFHELFDPPRYSDLMIYVHLKVDCVWNVMAHSQIPDFVFGRNGRVHLNRRVASVQSTTGSRSVHISSSNPG